LSVESPPSLQRQVSVPGGPAWTAALDPAAPRQVPGAGATGSAASLASSSRPRPPAGKKKGQKEGGPAAAGERPGTEDEAAVRTPTTDAQHRR